MTNFHEVLARDHVAPVQIPISYPEFQYVASLFLKFLDAVPDAQKRLVHFESPFKRGTADGYSDARDREGKDYKEYFHYSPRLDKFPEYHKLKEESREARDFFDAAESIYRRIRPVARDIFTREFPELASHCVVNDDLPNAVIRFLCYTPRGAAAFNAKAHYDKSYGTIALAESGPGLRASCCDVHPFKTVVHETGTGLFMAGELMFEDSQKAIIPAWHDVVTEEDSKPVSNRCKRWAIVFFIDDKDGRYPPWDAVHNPLKVHQ